MSIAHILAHSHGRGHGNGRKAQRSMVWCIATQEGPGTGMSIAHILAHSDGDGCHGDGGNVQRAWCRANGKVQRAWCIAGHHQSQMCYASAGCAYLGAFMWSYAIESAMR
jgi:hypothetical protein